MGVDELKKENRKLSAENASLKRQLRRFETILSQHGLLPDSQPANPPVNKSSGSTPDEKKRLKADKERERSRRRRLAGTHESQERKKRKASTEAARSRQRRLAGTHESKASKQKRDQKRLPRGKSGVGATPANKPQNTNRQGNQAAGSLDITQAQPSGQIYAAFDQAFSRMGTSSETQIGELAYVEEGGQQRQNFYYDEDAAQELLYGGDKAGEHHNLLTLGEAIDYSIIAEAVDGVRNLLAFRDDFEILPVEPFINSAIHVVPILPPFRRPNGSTLAVVLVGDHYVTLATRRDQLHIVHVIDSLQQCTHQSQNRIDHIARVGAAMLRLTSTAGLTLRFYKQPQQGPYNSCGVFAVFYMAAVLFSVPISAIIVRGREAEEKMRRSLHDSIFCNSGSYSLAPLKVFLADAAKRGVAQGETVMDNVGPCPLCRQLPLNSNTSDSNKMAQRPDISKPSAKLPRSHGIKRQPVVSDVYTPASLRAVGSKKGGKKPKSVSLGSATVTLLNRPGVPADQACCCPHCGSKLFVEEAGHKEKVTKQWCCGKGTLLAPSLVPYQSEFLRENGWNNSWVDPHVASFSRHLNNMFCFAAVGVTGKWVNPNFGTAFVKILGKTYHRLHDLSWQSNMGARVNQLCIVDSKYRQSHARSVHLKPDIVEKVNTFLTRVNSLYGEFRKLGMIKAPEATLRFETVSRRKHGPVLGEAPGQHQNLMPLADEVAAVLSANPEAEPHQVVIWKKGEAKSRTLHYLDPKYEALSFPLLRPHAEASWHKDMVSTTGVAITQLRYYRQMQLRFPRFRLLDRLGQEEAVTAYINTEQARLDYVRRNQNNFWMASREELAQLLGEECEGGRVGRRVILPATFSGSQRHMRKLYQDGMALVGRLGKPTYFITMTCNANWPEIDPPGDAFMCARVFHIKALRLLKDVTEGKLFGIKSRYYFYVIEYQKRGLPHMHLLVRLEDEPTQEEIEDHIWAVLPDTTQPQLREVILRHNVHGPCGKANPSSPCMDKDSDTCTKNFPKGKSDYFYIDERGYPVYARPCKTQAKKEKRGKKWTVTDRDIVPYNRHLSMKYNCHINIEYASSAMTVKYLYKYMSKGPDMANTAVLESGAEIDEIADYESRRYLGAAEAFWRLSSFDMHGRSIPVIPLHIHLPGKELLAFNPKNPALALQRSTTLTRYLDRPKDGKFDNLTYVDYFENYIESKDQKEGSVAHPDGVHFIKQRQRGECVARINWIPGGMSELAYFRLILHHKALRSFTDALTVENVVHSTFQQAAKALGLAKDNLEYFLIIDEAAGFLPGSALRYLFLSLIVGQHHVEPFPSRDIWDKRRDKFAEDFLSRDPISVEVAYEEALRHMSRLLLQHGRSLEDEGLPIVKDVSTEVERERKRFPKKELDNFLNYWKPLLSLEQRHIINVLISIVSGCPSVPWPSSALGRERPRNWCPLTSYTLPCYVFLEAMGGCGKTVVLNFVADYLRRQGHVVLSTATTGIASLSLHGGITAHSMFRLPFEVSDHNAVCNISMGSERAELIRQATAIIIDEALMLHRVLLWAFLRLLKDLKMKNLHFVLFAGNFNQIPPVVKWGTKKDILQASIKFDPFWSHVHVLRLFFNQRASADAEYAAMVEKIGNDSLPTVQLPGSAVNLTPLPLIQTVPDMQAMVQFVYPNLQDPYTCLRRAILAGTNQRIDEINAAILSQLPGKEEVLISADTCTDDRGGNLQLSPETLGGLTDIGVPPHRLRLKPGAIAMIVRNINFPAGLCNSLKVIVRRILPSRRLVEVETPPEAGQTQGKLHLIPRISFVFQPGGKGLNVMRHQFPLRLAWSITHNKSQGQTLERVGCDLNNHVFAHGQLYVDVSRARRRQDIKVLVPPSRVVDGVPHALNIVYPELLGTEAPPEGSLPLPGRVHTPEPVDEDSDASIEY